MENTKLFYLLKSFSKTDLKELNKFINSPFHNSNKKIIELLILLQKYLNKPNDKAPKIEFVFSQIYPGKKYNSFIIRNLFSNMVKLIEEFISISMLKENTQIKEKQILQNLRMNNHESLYEKKIEEIFKELKKTKVKDEKYFLELHDLLFERRMFEEQQLHPGKRQKAYDSITEETNCLISFFVTLMLKKYFNITNYKRTVNFSHNMHLYRDVMKILETNKSLYKDNILLEIFHSFLVLYETKNDNELYFKIKSLVLENKNRIPSDDYKNFGIELYNYAKSRRMVKDTEFKTESYELLKQLVQEDVFTEEGYMTAHSYINIAASAFLEKDFKWAENFIEDYKDKIIPSQKENAYNYNLAVFNYLKGYESKDIAVKHKYYNQSLEIISRVKSEDFYYMTRIKKNQIKIYYELNENNNLDNTSTAFRQYLNQNDRMSNEFKELNFTFLGYIQKLKTLRQNPSKLQAKKLVNEIEEKEKMELKSWFIDRIKEIQKSL